MPEKKNGKKSARRCETCLYLEFDEEFGDYICTVGMDEDESEKLAYSHYSECPFYRDGDEYKTVRKQN